MYRDTRQPENRNVVTVELPAGVNAAIKLVVMALVISGLYVAREILVPFALAALLGFILDPLVGRLRRRGMPRAVSVLVVSGVALAATLGVSVVLGTQVVELAKQIPGYRQSIEHKLNDLRTSLSSDAAMVSAARLVEFLSTQVNAPEPVIAVQEQSSPARQAPPTRVQVVGTEHSPLQAARAWIMPVLEPLLTAGLAIVLVIFILLEREELRDRMLRLIGADLHDMTDALDEAAQRVSRYLTMQLLVNVGYGLPLAVGLWLIGVPGALLWGALAAMLRFVPYLGPALASVFPLAMAFAVDPQWNMMAWTLGLVIVLELVSNNIIEPWLYGASTGIATVAMLLSAAFWTALWGPVGLILATPLTVCLVTMGRYLPHLQFLDLMLGSDPALDTPTRLYQRMLAGRVDEAMELAEREIEAESLSGFYSHTAIPSLMLATANHSRAATVEQRLRVATGFERLLKELRADHPATRPAEAPAVLSIALRWRVDELAAEMVAHSLEQQGIAARSLGAATLSADGLATLDLRQVRLVCLSSFHAQPAAQMRHFCRRIRRLNPGVRILLLPWALSPAASEQSSAEEASDLAATGADGTAYTLDEAVSRAAAWLQAADLVETDPDARDTTERAARMAGLPFTPAAPAAPAAPAVPAASAPADPSCSALILKMLQKAVEGFNVAQSMVVWRDPARPGQYWQAKAGAAAFEVSTLETVLLRPVVIEAGQPLRVPDLRRDPRGPWHPATPDSPAMPSFLVAVPLQLGGSPPNSAAGALCLCDHEARAFSDADLDLLKAMAAELAQCCAPGTGRPDDDQGPFDHRGGQGRPASLETGAVPWPAAPTPVRSAQAVWSLPAGWLKTWLRHDRAPGRLPEAGGVA